MNAQNADPFASYPFDKCLLSLGITPKVGTLITVANRYIHPEPFSIVVDHVIDGDMHTNAKIVSTDGGQYPVSVCFLPETKTAGPDADRAAAAAEFAARLGKYAANLEAAGVDPQAF